MSPLATLVDVDALWKILLAGIAGGAGVVVAFGLVLLGRSRYLDADGETAVARGGYLLLAAFGAAVCVAALVLGFIAMTKK
jgi:F0F1-type ATP synthase membrane subunit c/vacuolar-type H+-ATPase subunit K